jgi:hypothetical protein
MAGRKFMKKTCFSLLLFSLILNLGSCNESKLEKINLQINGETFMIEVAREPADQQRGLMFRKELGEREGMLFIYKADQQLAFWMKNVEIPLSIAFLNKDGIIMQLEDMKPFDPTTIRSTLSVRYALEVKQGVFQKIGAKVGDKAIFSVSN